MRLKISTGIIRTMLLAIFLFIGWQQGIGQQSQVIQVKTYDQQLNILNNEEVSINGKPFVSVGSKGAFIELQESDLPVKTVKVKDQSLEAASWSLSKGRLQVILRKKNYEIISVFVRHLTGEPVGGIDVKISGKNPITLVTDKTGKIDVPIQLNEKLSASMFTVRQYEIVSLNEQNILIIKPVVPEKTEVKESEVASIEKVKDEVFQFDLSKLDSIQSLTVFYAIFKNYNIKTFDARTKKKVDDKFNKLVRELQDSIRHSETLFVNQISDSSRVTEDFSNLLRQARIENQLLDEQRNEFDEKIKLIQQKLSAGVTNLDDDTKTKIISDLASLEQLLVENEGRFYKNQNYYRQIVGALRESFFNMEDLENELSFVQAQRMEEQKEFRKKLLIVSSVLLVFGILIVLLISLSHRLRKKRKEVEKANEEIRHINENLEELVSERTKLLTAANRELDTFLYRASHDLRSPVCSIVGLCHLAIHFSTGEAKDIMEKVVDTTTTMDKLLKKLTIISEINQPTKYGEIDLVQVVREVTEDFDLTIRQNNISLTIEQPYAVQAYTYPGLLSAIVANLVENAVYFTAIKKSEDRTISIKLSVDADDVLISVYDNGVGIDSKILEKAFDMFFKGNVYSKGNGLGLYIVERSIQALGGSVNIESEVDRYTRVTVRIPLKQNDPKFAIEEHHTEMAI